MISLNSVHTRQSMNLDQIQLELSCLKLGPLGHNVQRGDNFEV
mgnify:CR=1